MENGGAIHQSEVAGDIAGDDDALALDSNDLAALQEFLRVQEEDERLLPEEREDDNVTLGRLSQFWYNSDTAETVACKVHTIVAGSPEARVACIACPTLYAYLKSQECIEKVALHRPWICSRRLELLVSFCSLEKGRKIEPLHFWESGRAFSTQALQQTWE